MAIDNTHRSAADRPLHRLGEARRREGVTRRTLARRLDISAGDVQDREQPSADMLLSELYRWQEALGVPLADLLDEPQGELCQPVRIRAQLVLLMKTVRSIQERASQTSVQRLAQVLNETLVEVMPELKETAAWPTVGPRRSQDDPGQAYYRRLLLDPVDEWEGLEESWTPS
jgi:transcriptional regulator with XRE-family HTH domain